MAVLLVECPDQRGLVHAVAGVLLAHGVNIESNHEHVDRLAGRFYMRTEFSGEADAARVLADVKAVLPASAHVRLNAAHRPDVVVLVTREYHCLAELLVRHAFEDLGCRIRAVVGNHELLKPLVEKFGLPFVTVSHEGLSREAHEAAVAEAVNTWSPDYLVLAKYMRVLSPQFVARWPQRIINIHHSFLPAFVGASPYKQAWERGVKIIGATAHVVTDDLDEGPIIAQSVIPVDHSHSAADLAQAGRDVEKIVLAKALKLVFEDRVMLNGNRTVIFE